jgi:hypothetical protein
MAHPKFLNALVFLFLLGLSDLTAQNDKGLFQLQEVINVDSTPSSELLKRAVNWVKIESPRFVKNSGITSGTKAECVASFNIKPKELNPQPDYTGTITMHVSIECKDNRYKYTITKIKHTSKTGKASGGDINNIVPDCGSMIMPDLVWKKIKGEAIRHSNAVLSELKQGMSQSSALANSKEEW